MPRPWIAALAIIPALVGMGAPLDAQVTVTPVAVHGSLANGTQISAVARIGNLLILGADEGNAIQLLRAEPDGYTWSRSIDLLDDPDTEMDIEGLVALDNGDGTITVVATGSHGTARKKPEDDKTQNKNLERLQEIKPEPDRSRFVRLRLDARTGQPLGDVELGSLLPFLEASPLFEAVFPAGSSPRPPSKEGGLDIEGLAVATDSSVVFGLRGPVLLGEYTPVIFAPFDQPEQAQVRFVRLGGLGIRGMTSTAGWYLLLAGPVGDGNDYRLFWWNGVDMVPGTDAAPARLVDLASVPRPAADAKAEGVTLLAEDEGGYTVLVVYDSAANGGLTRLTIPKPESLE